MSSRLWVTRRRRSRLLSITVSIVMPRQSPLAASLDEAGSRADGPASAAPARPVAGRQPGLQGRRCVRQALPIAGPAAGVEIGFAALPMDWQGTSAGTAIRACRRPGTPTANHRLDDTVGSDTSDKPNRACIWNSNPGLAINALRPPRAALPRRLRRPWRVRRPRRPERWWTRAVPPGVQRRCPAEARASRRRRLSQPLQQLAP